MIKTSRCSNCCSLVPLLLLAITTSTTITRFTNAQLINFYLQFTPLNGGYGTSGKIVLEDALSRFTPTLDDVWLTQLQQASLAENAAADANNGGESAAGGLINYGSINAVDVETMGRVFGDSGSYFGGFHITDLTDGAPYQTPSPGQNKFGDTSFVQRVAFGSPGSTTVVKDKESLLDWTAMAFANNAFLPFLQLAVQDHQEIDSTFASVTQVEMIKPEDYNPTHDLHYLYDLINQPIKLELGPASTLFTEFQQQQLIGALDQFFQDVIGLAIRDAIETHPSLTGVDVYSLHSIPDSSTNTYFSLDTGTSTTSVTRQQSREPYVTGKPSVVTFFKYDYGLTYWVPIGLESMVILLIQQISENAVQNSFANNAFLPYVLALGDGWQDITFVNAVGETSIPSSTPSLMPSNIPTMMPSSRPSSSPSSHMPSSSPSSAPSMVPTFIVSQSRYGIPLGAVIGIIVAAVIVCLLIMFIIYRYQKQKNLQDDEQAQKLRNDFAGESADNDDVNEDEHEDEHRMPDVSDPRLADEHV